MIAIWFAVVSFMLIAYVVLDGRNFGAGMLHWLVAKTPLERRQVVAAIGPLWSWHEVWLVGFGGTLVMVFPRLMASAFSGYYLALMLILWVLILRGIAIEVAGHINDHLWQGFWDFVFVLANALLAILFGAAAGNLERGVPLDTQGNFSMAFFTNFRTHGYVGLLDWYTVSVAIFVAVLLAAHGATYLTLKTEGPVHDRSAKWANYLWAAVVPLFLAISIESWVVRPDLFQQGIYKPFCWLGILGAVISGVTLISGLSTHRETRAFVGSNGVLVGVLGAGAAALFPVMLHSTLAPENSLTAYAVASNRPAFLLASIWWPIAFILATAYFIFISRRYVGKASVRRDNQGFYELKGEEKTMNEKLPRVVIVGGGFGGLAAAKALRWAPVEVILIDRTNHHLFQPLLYQVATSVLAPGQIGTPIRGILGKQRNTTVILGEVSAVNKDQRYVVASTADRSEVHIPYDYLILATGQRHSYFGHNEFERFAPGLKSLGDAVAIRNRILSAFEQAEAEEDPSAHPELLTFVLVGAGPTGVEMAAALAVMVQTSLSSEFRRIDPLSARIVLVDMANRVLGTFAEDISAAAKRRLENLGVEVQLGHGVDQIDEDGVIVAGERIASRTVIWTAGVAPSPAGKWLGVETDRAGRVKIQSDLTVPGHPEVFVVGDTASLQQDGKPLPGVAQVALQQGRYAGKLIRRRAEGKPALSSFRYFDKGNMAVVGKGFAVVQSGKIHLSGFLAWLAWAGIHIQFLATTNLRISVFVQWMWTFLTGQRGSRLIVNQHTVESTSKPQEPALVASRSAVAVATSHQ
jgi:NADH dehydrogenase FAD-containing subunit/cytochrome bd-type quinol oxidase subunit 2